MKIIAVDDEELALEGLLETIREAEPEAELNGFLYAEDAMEFAKEHSCDVAFLDVEMPGVTGVGLADQLKLLYPEVNIIFATGYEQYRRDAFELHASGYLKKPITAEKVRFELDNLRRPVAERRRIQVRAFGNFEVYLDGKPLSFKYGKTKELLAYLVDRNGALCTNGEIIATLFEDNGNHDAYLRSLRKDLTDTLEAFGCGNAITQQRGSLGVVREAVSCDYYDYNAGKRLGCVYRGEYMSQYSWAEYTGAMLSRTL